MNFKKLKKTIFINKIFSQDFSLDQFEKSFSECKNIIKDERNTIKGLSIQEIDTVTKSFKIPNSFQGFIYKFFRKSKARRSYENSLLLNKEGIPTPEPLGYIEVFSRFRLRQSYFISRKLEYDFTLGHVIDKKTEDYRNILNRFIYFTYKMHKKNLMHLDYCVGNICVMKTTKGYDFYLVDLNRFRKGKVNSKKGVENLARISKDHEVIKILADEYSKRVALSFNEIHKLLLKSVKTDTKRLKLKKFIKNFGKEFANISASIYDWDYYSNQPYTLNSKNLKNKIALKAWYSNIKIIVSSLFALSIVPFFYLKNKKSFEIKIDSFGLCVNLDPPMESQKSIKSSELIEMIEELSVHNVLVRIPLRDFENIEKYFSFITQLKNKNKDILICILQDRKHIADKNLTRERLDFIFKRLENVVSAFQIGNSINRKKWAFISIDEYFSFFKVAYDLKRKKYPGVKLLGGSIIDFDIPFFIRSIFHLKPIKYDGIATQLYVDRRGNPEEKQLGFNTIGKIRLYSALAKASNKTSNKLYITEVNWPLYGMGKWAPAKTHLIEESLQSSYLVRYFLLMLASGKVKKCYWHQLIAPGYGLVNNLNGQIIKRDAYFCFKHLIQIFNGGKVIKLRRNKSFFCFAVEKNDTVIEAIWSDKENGFLNKNFREEVYDMRGKIIETKNSSGISITGDVIFLKYEKNNYIELNLDKITSAKTFKGKIKD